MPIDPLRFSTLLMSAPYVSIIFLTPPHVNSKSALTLAIRSPQSTGFCSFRPGRDFFGYLLAQ